ncbi:MAG: response regulator transcription factor [Candidatus Dojkabacteria bacterium]
MQRVLIVDDNKRLAANLSRYLSHAGLYTTTRNDAESALSLLDSGVEQIDAAVFDIKLPKMSGLELCKKLRAKRNLLPILMLTGVNETGSIIHTLDSGADDYLTKPFVPAEVLARVKALMRRPLLFERNILEFDDLSIDLDKKEVTFLKHVLQLRPREYELLVYLCKNNQQVLAREQILVNVWGGAWRGQFKGETTNSIDVHIKELRNKFAKVDPDKTVIQTVYGYGYKILV